MRILVVGGGGREHALAWRLGFGQPEDEQREIICAPGNPGMEVDAECVPVSVGDIDGLVDLARGRSVDLVVVGPEAPLMSGLADKLWEQGIPTLGPRAAAAALEGSKAFAKEIMTRAGIPTAAYGVFDDADGAREFARGHGGKVAVKADGLAAGKGVILCRSVEESDAAVAALMEDRALGAAGERVVVEELLEGEEASFIALCDGERVLPLAPSRDHKAAFDGDEGPNTGGMGAFSPTRLVDDELADRVVREIMEPTIKTLADDGAPFRGVLYAGLMITEDGPKVLEFNVRFGDPETQPLMMRMQGDIAPVLLAAANGELGDLRISWDPRPAVCVVLASGGYPGEYETGLEISGLDDIHESDELVIFHAGTRRDDAGRVVTAGGRVLGVTAKSEGLSAARRRAYDALDGIRFASAWFRTDIGAKEDV